MAEDDDLIAGTDDEEGVVVGDCVTPKVIAIVADVLHVPKSELDLDTAAADIEAWDSFGHVRIVLAVDKAFGVQLSMGAIEKADSIGALVDAVEEALAQG